MDIAKIKLSQLAQHGDLMDRYGASIRILGQTSLVSPDVLDAIIRATEMTKHNKRYIDLIYLYRAVQKLTLKLSGPY